MIALQCCVGFCHTTACISHKYVCIYIYIPSLLNLPPLLLLNCPISVLESTIFVSFNPNQFLSQIRSFLDNISLFFFIPSAIVQHMPSLGQFYKPPQCFCCHQESDALLFPPFTLRMPHNLAPVAPECKCAPATCCFQTCPAHSDSKKPPGQWCLCFLLLSSKSLHPPRPGLLFLPQRISPDLWKPS